MKSGALQIKRSNRKEAKHGKSTRAAANTVLELALVELSPEVTELWRKPPSERGALPTVHDRSYENIDIMCTLCYIIIHRFKQDGISTCTRNEACLDFAF